MFPMTVEQSQCSESNVTKRNQILNNRNECAAAAMTPRFTTAATPATWLLLVEVFIPVECWKDNKERGLVQ